MWPQNSCGSETGHLAVQVLCDGTWSDLYSDVTAARHANMDLTPDGAWSCASIFAISTTNNNAVDSAETKCAQAWQAFEVGWNEITASGTLPRGRGNHGQMTPIPQFGE